MIIEWLEIYLKLYYPFIMILINVYQESYLSVLLKSIFNGELHFEYG